MSDSPIARIQRQRDLEVKIAKRIMAQVPGTKPMEALDIAEKITRRE